MLDTASPDVIIEGEGGGQQWGRGASCAADRGLVHRHMKAPRVLLVGVHLEVLKWDWISVFRLRKSGRFKVKTRKDNDKFKPGGILKTLPPPSPACGRPAR